MVYRNLLSFRKWDLQGAEFFQMQTRWKKKSILCIKNQRQRSYRSRRSRKETWHQRKSLGNFWLQYEFNLKVTKNSQEGVEAKQRGSKCPCCMFPHCIQVYTCIWIPKTDFKIWYILSIVYVQRSASVIRITSDSLPKKIYIIFFLWSFPYCFPCCL